MSEAESLLRRRKKKSELAKVSNEEMTICVCTARHAGSKCRHGSVQMTADLKCHEHCASDDRQRSAAAAEAAAASEELLQFCECLFVSLSSTSQLACFSKKTKQNGAMGKQIFLLFHSCRWRCCRDSTRVKIRWQRQRNTFLELQSLSCSLAPVIYAAGVHPDC